MSELLSETTGNLLSGAGNHEAKLATLLSMKNGVIYPIGPLHKTIMQVQGANPGWRINNRTVFNYCRDSLGPIGLVTREVLDKNLNTYGYMRSDYGTQVGMPFAGHLLFLSERHPDFPLTNIWGQTSSKSRAAEIETPEGDSEYRARTPILRFKIFWELATRQLPIRITDLADALELDKHHLSNILPEMARDGIVFFDTVKSNEPRSTFKLAAYPPGTEPPSFGGYTKLTGDVYKVVLDQRGKELTREEIMNGLGSDRIDKYQKTYILTGISQILSHLETEGYIERGKFGFIIGSIVDLTPTQRGVIIDALDILDRFMSGDITFLAEGQRLAQEISNDPDRLSALLAKARNASSHANQTPMSETKSNILSILQLFPGLNNHELRGQLKLLFDQDYSEQGIRHPLRALREENLIKAEKRKNSLYWTSI